MAAAAMTSGPSASSEIAVTYEDQQKINRFARLNARKEEILEELKVKKTDLQNMEDALNEVSNAELTADDPDEGVKIMEGELFVRFGFEGATKWIEEKKATLEAEIEQSNEQVEKIKEEMNQLKIALYAKFGKDNINLESED